MDNLHHTSGIYQEDLAELRRLAVPVARFLIEHGLLDGVVRIDTLSVDVFCPRAGAPFTPGDEAQIFRDESTRA